MRRLLEFIQTIITLFYSIQNTIPNTNTKMMKFTALLIATMSSVVSGAGHIAAGQDLVNVGWSLPYEGPKTVALKVGDTISFSWDSGHNVYIHPTMNCGLDGAIFVGDSSTTEYTFTDADDGKDIFFSCDIGNGAHCQNGKYPQIKHSNVILLLVTIVKKTHSMIIFPSCLNCEESNTIRYDTIPVSYTHLTLPTILLV